MKTDTKAVARWDYCPRRGMDTHPKGAYIEFSDHERVVAELKNRIDVYDLSQVCDKEEIAKQAIVIGNKEFTNETLRTALAASRAEVEGLKKDAERYRWLRNPGQDVGLVLDKVVGETPMDEQGFGGYKHYEYRAGEELDTAIDAAMEKGNV